MSKLELKDSLVYILDTPVTREEAMRRLASLLQAGGYVKESFAQAVLEREKVFPTGLPTQPVGIALPHTDSEHVHCNAMAIGVLSHPVVFTEMGCLEDAPVDAHVIFMLAIANPQDVTSTLRELALSFQDADFLAGLDQATNPQIVLDLCAARLPNVVQVVRVAEKEQS